MQVELRQLKTGNLRGEDLEGLRHVKALPFFSVVQATEGYYTIRLEEGAPCDTRVFLAPSQVRQTITHHMDPKTGRMAARWAFLDLYVDGSPVDLLYQFPLTAPEEELNPLMENLFAAEDPCDRMSVGYQLVKWLLRLGIKKEDPYAQTLRPVTELIRRNYKTPISVAEMAEAAHLSASHFYAVFKKFFGCSPVTYLNDYRLSMASVLLKETLLSVGQIAGLVGIPDPFYFNRLFKRKYGKTPLEYRKTP